MAEIIPFRHTANVPEMLREMADEIEKGVLELDTFVALVPRLDDAPDLYLFGKPMTSAEIIGHLQLAIHGFIGARL